MRARTENFVAAGFHEDGRRPGLLTSGRSGRSLACDGCATISTNVLPWVDLKLRKRRTVRRLMIFVEVELHDLAAARVIFPALPSLAGMDWPHNQASPALAVVEPAG